MALPNIWEIEISSYSTDSLTYVCQGLCQQEMPGPVVLKVTPHRSRELKYSHSFVKK